MAITTAMANTFKKELLTATHNFATNGNAFKLALYTTAASIGAATATFTTTGQVGNTFEIQAVFNPASLKPTAALKPEPPAPRTTTSYS